MALTDIELGRLKCMLGKDFVPHLPALLHNNKTLQDQITKNLSRAFSAFVLAELCHLEPDIASKMVVDDFNDCGIDAIYLHAPEQALYLVQVKLKAGRSSKNLRHKRSSRVSKNSSVVNFLTSIVTSRSAN